MPEWMAERSKSMTFLLITLGLHTSGVGVLISKALPHIVVFYDG